MIRSYTELIDALADRRRALGMSQAEVDKRAGFCDGYMSKVEAWRGKRGRGLGLLTLPPLLQTLGVALALVPLDDPLRHAERRVTALTGSNSNAVRHLNPTDSYR